MTKLVDAATVFSQDNIVDRFIQVYQSLSANNLEILHDIYAEDIEFIDPVHRISGFENVYRYMETMYKNLHQYQITVLDVVDNQSTAFLDWSLSFIHPRLNRGEWVTIPGATKICFEKKIHYHCDFYDLGAMIYENIPLYGGVTRAIKRRIAK
ncbi:nuclear transport factor 2 family protein [Pleionea litopenaei]|uniref:Nuclear transport factor 2 family protein n=1 Tax=Pleionea litopenaei TaxID=3070815 RepID=A0AA51X7T4_9GAMM|nr:nuclear transport factor 2 family protein [Pleionea sp. HL-JVS1]WMS88239.1 nuclear transport factor 2 family protein [Pleionea sp. HL-JVS1]